jgi:hypothetical protein
MRSRQVAPRGAADAFRMEQSGFTRSFEREPRACIHAPALPLPLTERYVITLLLRMVPAPPRDWSMQSDTRRQLIRGAIAALILGLVIFMLVDAFGSSAAGLRTQPSWSFALRLKTEAWSDPGLRLRALIILFAAIAGTRLILGGLSRTNRRWSMIVGGMVLAVSLARELPGFLERASPTAPDATARSLSGANPEPRTPQAR